MHLLFYISGHGFGHAARDVQVINAVVRRDPATRVTIRTTVPEWFLRASLTAPAEIVRGDTDSGVAQPDSLSIDEDDTARRAARFYADLDSRVSAERTLMRALSADLVVGDIPPLAFAAADAAGVRSVAFGNFTWDWIFRAYPAFATQAPGVCDLIGAANAAASLALRLPFAGGFASMARVEEVPLVARRATVGRDETRRRLNLPGDRPLVLATFGGHGRHVPLAAAAASGSFRVVATDYEVGTDTPACPNLHVVRADALTREQLAYTDLLAACDVVVTKLGYGIVSECIANGVALLYTPRGRFVEQDVFIEQMPPVVRSREITQDDLRAGRWTDSIDALLSQPLPSRSMRSDGADVVAARLLDYA